MIERDISEELRRLAAEYPVVTLGATPIGQDDLGPHGLSRQSLDFA